MPPAPSDLTTRTRVLAQEVAAKHADDVDAKARFPQEAIEALRKAKLLAAAAPAELGGGGAGMYELAAMCTALAQACGSSGMVLAMHHIQAACIARHGLSSPYFRTYLQELVERQLLIGAATPQGAGVGAARARVSA